MKILHKHILTGIFTSLILSVLLMIAFTGEAEAAGKSLYLNQFNNSAISEDQTLRLKNQMEKIFFEKGYNLTTPDDFAAGVGLEELRQTMGSEDDRFMKALMAKSSIDLTVYGSVRRQGTYTYITAKMLDKTRGSVELARIKTVRIHDMQYYSQAGEVVTQYLIDGNTDKVQDFQDEMYKLERVEQREEITQELRDKDQQAQDEYERKVQEYKEKRYSDITDKFSFFRLGYSFVGVQAENNEFNDHYGRGMLFFTDLIISGRKMTGFDFYVRYTYRSFEKTKDTWGGSDAEVYTLWNANSKLSVNQWDFGLRYRWGTYILMTKFDLYMLGAARYNSFLEYEGDYKDGWWSFNTGAGLEMAFFPSIGIFTEYNWGRSFIPETDINIEDHQIISGVTWRL